MFSNPSVSGGGLTKWTESETLYSGKHYARLAINSAQTNVDAVFSPKGTGGFSLQQADGTTAGGNARGQYSFDASMDRSSASQVASGSYAFAQGYSVTTSGTCAFAQGASSIASGTYAFAQGVNTTASGSCAFAQGASSIASADYAFAQGSATASGSATFAQGYNTTASGNYAFAQGFASTAWRYGESSRASGSFNVNGDAQKSELILRANTTSATPVAMTADGAATGTLNQLILKNNETVTCKGLLTCKKSGSTSSVAGFEITVQATRGTTAASTVINFAGITETVWNPDGVSLAITADTTNGGVTFTVTTPTGNWHSVLTLSLGSTIFA